MTWASDIAVGALVSWGYLMLFHGRFITAGPTLDREPREAPETWPAVVAILPARNEADVVKKVIESHLAQDYPGPFRIVLVDDGSDDGTAAAAQSAAKTDAEAARLTVLQAAERPPGWVGKLWAMESGIRAIDAQNQPTFLWLTDADVTHEPTTLRRLVAEAEREDRGQQASLVSLMVKLWCESFWEKLLIPAYVLFFKMLYPFHWVNRGRMGMSAAAGGCMLVRREDLEQAGGLAAIRGAIIDDCGLAQLIRPVAREQNRRLHIALTQKSHSIRPYEGLGDIWRMVARSAFTQLRYSPLALVGTVAGMLFLYLSGPLLLVTAGLHGDGRAGFMGLTLWAIMALAWIPMLDFYKVAILRGFLLPFVALLFTAMTLDSARRHWQGKGAQWKGRVGAGKAEG